MCEKMGCEREGSGGEGMKEGAGDREYLSVRVYTCSITDRQIDRHQRDSSFSFIIITTQSVFSFTAYMYAYIILFHCNILHGTGCDGSGGSTSASVGLSNASRTDVISLSWGSVLPLPLDRISPVMVMGLC